MGITKELGAKGAKSTRIPINHVLQHLRDDQRKRKRKADTVLHMQAR